jgi:hypothetical protein
MTISDHEGSSTNLCAEEIFFEAKRLYHAKNLGTADAGSFFKVYIRL